MRCGRRHHSAVAIDAPSAIRWVVRALDPMRAPLSTGGDLVEFIMAEFDRRDIKLPKTHDLPKVLTSWRAREPTKTEDRAKILALVVRGCTFVDVAKFC